MSTQKIACFLVSILKPSLHRTEIPEIYRNSNILEKVGNYVGISSLHRKMLARSLDIVANRNKSSNFVNNPYGRLDIVPKL